MAVLFCFLLTVVLAAAAVQCALHSRENATYDYIGMFRPTPL